MSLYFHYPSIPLPIMNPLSYLNHSTSTVQPISLFSIVTSCFHVLIESVDCIIKCLFPEYQSDVVNIVLSIQEYQVD